MMLGLVIYLFFLACLLPTDTFHNFLSDGWFSFNAISGAYVLYFLASLSATSWGFFFAADSLGQTSL